METQPGRRSLLARFFLSPGEPRLRLGWRLLAHLMLLILFTALAAPLLAPFFDDSPQAFFIAGQAVTLIAITLATFIARRWIDQRSIASLGLVWNRQAAIDLAFGIALPALQMSLIFAVEWSFGWLTVDGWSASSLGWGAVLVELGVLFAAFCVVGWQEELLTRGYWLQNLIDGLNLPAAVVISSIVFALLHLANPNPSFMAVVGLTAAGLFFAYSYLVTRQLWLPIGLHIGWNFFEGPVFGFPVSGLAQFFSLLNTSRHGPELITGGAFGPEAGLIQYPVLLLAVWLIHRYARQRVQNPS
jgi:uncharacterized protein